MPCPGHPLKLWCLISTTPLQVQLPPSLPLTKLFPKHSPTNKVRVGFKEALDGIQFCVAGQTAPDGADHRHHLGVHRRRKPAQQVAQRHDGLLPQPRVHVGLRGTVQDEHKLLDKVLKEREQQNLGNILREGGNDDGKRMAVGRDAGGSGSNVTYGEGLAHGVAQTSQD